MARAPFKLRSGNASTFKNLGSSPAKQDRFGSKEGNVEPKKKHEFPPETNPNPPTRDKTIQETQANYPGPESGGPPKSGDGRPKAKNAVKGENEARTESQPKLSEPVPTEEKKGTKKTKTTKGPIMPKDHPVTPPTDKQSKESKGTVKGLTNFEYDMKPVTNVINKTVKPYKELGKKVLKVHKKINPIEAYKKVKKYFTEK